MKRFLVYVLTVLLLTSSASAWKQPQKVESQTAAQVTITYPHHEIHAGSAYTAHYDNTTASNDDDVSCIGFTTSNTGKWMHLVVQVTASSPAELFIEEGVTLTNGKGTEATIYNKDRNSSNTSLAIDLSASPAAGKVTTLNETQFNDTSGYSVGTIVDHMQLAGGEGPKAVGGSSRGSQEWILKQNTKYLFRLQNIGANANLHEIHLDWYEHTNK